MTVSDADPLVTRAFARRGTVLRGKWRLDDVIGVGGMATVYSATHRNGARVAIKILHQELSIDANVRGRFLREGYVANSIGHRGAVFVTDDDTTDDGAVFLVMELLDGESMEARCERVGGSLDVVETLSIADQVLDVLAAAHDKGIVHRDIKPDNVFVCVDGVIKVLDFGIARVRELSTASTATRTGTSMGTPCYMPPEQARGRWELVDARSDLWAVGATMFRGLTGHLVHEAQTVNEQLLAAMTHRAESVARIKPSVPAVVGAVVDRALAFDRGERFADAREMQEALRRAYAAMQGQPISTAPRLSVPAFATCKTLQSAPDARSPAGGATGEPVTSGRTGIEIRTAPVVTRKRRVVYAGVGIVGAIGLVAASAALLLPRVRQRSEASAGTGEVSGYATAVQRDVAAPASASTTPPVASAQDAPASIAVTELPAATTAPTSTVPRVPPPAKRDAAGPAPTRSTPDPMDRRR